ncbi:hypothetical protein HII31_05413 [Pseudocercospora fuligena]|uniref:Ecp2 effector protein domain-containing protein n=1 Tax=Pseudocercospora fuligena TaxID=685502 RepID=A0A8H6RLL7_9PEZI|nr:hypothetical protein HII31_05413 [Pseudocercospora fuligena]
MLSSIVLALAAVKAINAAPAAAPAIPASILENLGLDDVVLPLSGGGHEVVNYTTYIEKLVFEGISLKVPEIDHDYLNFTADPTPLDLSHLPLEKRQSCGNTRSTMSNVACAAQGDIDMFVMAGWSVANSVTVSSGLDPKIIKDWLGARFGVDYGRTWTSSASVQNKFTVKQGNCGVMITQPLTTRKYGRVLEGCVGSTKQVGTFMADDRGTGSYNGVSWINGAVSQCVKPGRAPPLTRCNGKGEFQ